MQSLSLDLATLALYRTSNISKIFLSNNSNSCSLLCCIGMLSALSKIHFLSFERGGFVVFLHILSQHMYSMSNVEKMRRQTALYPKHDNYKTHKHRDRSWRFIVMISHIA